MSKHTDIEGEKSISHRVWNLTWQNIVCNILVKHSMSVSTITRVHHGTWVWNDDNDATSDIISMSSIIDFVDSKKFTSSFTHNFFFLNYEWMNWWKDKRKPTLRRCHIWKQKRVYVTSWHHPLECDVFWEFLLTFTDKLFLILIRLTFEQMSSAKSTWGRIRIFFANIRKCDEKTSQNLNVKKFREICDMIFTYKRKVYLLFGYRFFQPIDVPIEFIRLETFFNSKLIWIAALESLNTIEI